MLHDCRRYFQNNQSEQVSSGYGCRWCDRDWPDDLEAPDPTQEPQAQHWPPNNCQSAPEACPISSVQAVVLCTPEAEQMMLVMSKNFPAYIAFILKDQGLMGDLITELV
jgi:hypothetical protein